MLLALGEGCLGHVEQRQGRGSEAVTLITSANDTLLDLQKSGYADPTLATEIGSTREALARTRVFVGDLDGALTSFEDLLRTTAPCDEQATPRVCRTLKVRLAWTADVYGAADRPNLEEPAKAAVLYERSARISERMVAQDDHDRQARFDLASAYGKLGDVVWKTDPKRALDLYERALASARSLASPEQFTILRDSYLTAISRPLIKLGRTAEARTALTEALEHAKIDARSNVYADVLGEASARVDLAPLLMAERKTAEARQVLQDLIRDLEALRSGHKEDLTTIYFLSKALRMLASITAGSERRDALLQSARAWHSWPATSFTMREEQKDLTAAKASLQSIGP